MNILITGASSGIGRDMAKYLDKSDNKLILVARDKKKLKELQKELKTVSEIYFCDLKNMNEVRKLYDTYKNKIDFLINNAGFGLFGLFYETDLEKELEMIDVNIKAVHVLTKLFLQDFVKKDSGRILNVCSSAGFMAGPRLNTYYATKNYVTKLTMAINEELRRMKSHVHISALCPGPVNTNFNKVANGFFEIKGATSEYVARYGIEKCLKNKMIIVPTFKIKLGIFMLRFIPFRLQLMIIYHIQKKKSVIS